VAMIGLSLAKEAISRFAGLGGADNVTESTELLVACITLGTMVGLVVWSKGNLRLYSAAIGLALGYSLSLATGILDQTAIATIARAGLFALPSWQHPGLSFDLYLAPTFIIGALASAVKGSGVVINCQKVNDPEWKRADMASVSKGLFADSVGCMTSGLLGGMGTSMSAVNVGLSMATGATSRRVGYAVGLFSILLVFLPKFSVVLILMPLPVIGAALLYVASYLIASGIQLIMTRMMDARRTFMVGLSFLAGISLDVVPELYQDLPSWAGPIFCSSLTVATIVAFTLNLIFRLGISQSATLSLTRQHNIGAEVYRFLENQGATWGARQQVIHEAKHILRELIEALFMHSKTEGPVHTEALFDEYNLNINVTYQGEPMEFPDSPPAQDELMHDKSSLARMSGFMIQFMAEKVTSTVESGTCKIHIHITH